MTTTIASETVEPENAVVVVDAAAEGRLIDPRVFGVNVPAWVGPDRLANPALIDAVRASGATLIRMPGGAWANRYDWAACEMADAAGCLWPWAATPSHYIAFSTSTGLEGMWTLSINQSAESAAAAVAFFNGRVGDQRTIGIDADGVDWGDVDRWASLRAERGFVEPIEVRLWEVGNEVYGGQRESGVRLARGSGGKRSGRVTAWTT